MSSRRVMLFAAIGGDFLRRDQQVTANSSEGASRRSRVQRLREEAVVGALEGGYRLVKARLHGKRSTVASRSVR